MTDVNINLGGSFDTGGFDPGAFAENGPTPVMALRQGLVTPAVSVSLAGLSMGAAQGAPPAFTSINPLSGLALAAAAGSVTPAVPLPITGFSLAAGQGTLPVFEFIFHPVGLPLVAGAGVILIGGTPDVDLSPTLDMLVVRYEERAITLLPEVGILGIPAEQIVLYVSPDSGPEGETH